MVVCYQDSGTGHVSHLLDVCSPDEHGKCTAFRNLDVDCHINHGPFAVPIARAGSGSVN